MVGYRSQPTLAYFLALIISFSKGPTADLSSIAVVSLRKNSFLIRLSALEGIKREAGAFWAEPTAVGAESADVRRERESFKPAS